MTISIILIVAVIGSCYCYIKGLWYDNPKYMKVAQLFNCIVLLMLFIKLALKQ